MARDLDGALDLLGERFKKKKKKKSWVFSILFFVTVTRLLVCGTRAVRALCV